MGLDAQATTASRLGSDDLVVVSVGKATAVEPQLGKVGLPYERIDFRDPISTAVRRAGGR